MPPRGAAVRRIPRGNRGAVEAVLFDLDDTLFDHRHARWAALRATRSAVPELSRIPLARLDRSYERHLSEVHFAEVLTGKLSIDASRRVRMSRFLKEFGIDPSPGRLDEVLQFRQEVYRRNRRAVPGAIALLRHLKVHGIVVGVVTNNLRAEQVEKLRVTGLSPLVDHLVCSEQVGFIKPDPRIFGAALTKTRSRPGATVMVGDSWESDVVGAAAVGIRPVWFHRDARPLPPAPPARDLRSLRPMKRALEVLLGPVRARD
jgi:putative hydrolase of the HAD superfamily